jgi:RHS repeat-associated protein
VIAEYENGAAPNAPTREYIYSGGALLAKIESGSTAYYHLDHLSDRLMTDSSGSVIGEQGHYPFGESWYENNTTTKWMFTSYERDAESGNDYATFRYNINRLGRFASPDLLAGSAANPQSLNRYAYVRDDPVNLVDPLGLRDCPNPTPGGCAIVSNGAGDDDCFTAACQNPGDVLLDGFVTDRGEAEAVVQAGFGFVCPTTDRSGGTLTTFNGVDSAIRVPNCSDPTVEDCGYSYYLTFGGALGLTGAQPQGPAQPPERPQGPAQPQSQAPERVARERCVQAANARADDAAASVLNQGFSELAKGALSGLVSGAVYGCLFASEVGCLEGALPGAIAGATGGALVGLGRAIYSGISGIVEVNEQFDRDLAACGGG